MKRQASRSPTPERSSKRTATSSPPEEGEVDDANGVTSSQSLLPPPPPTLPAKPVIAAPGAKTKAIPFPFKKKDAPIKPNNVFESTSRAGSRPEPPRGSQPKPRGADHWEPSQDRHDDRAHQRNSLDRNRLSSRSPRRDNRYLGPPPRLTDQKRSPTGFGPSLRNRSRSRSRERSQDHYRDRDRDRYRSQDHHNRDRDRDREREPWNRRGEGRMDRYSRPYKPPSAHSYKPQSPPSNSYRPQSPLSSRPASPPKSPQPPQPDAPPPPSLPESSQPRPPSNTPPPAPPPDTRLQSHHISIALPQPVQHSLPPKPDFLLNGPPARRPEPKEPPVALPPPPPKPPAVRVVRRRHASQRTAKQDIEAYGKTFLGCGSKSDYTITTKLGEGTFGEVHKAIQDATKRLVALKRILMHHEKEGMPVTALREIKILKSLKHPCIVDILDMFVVRSTDKDPLSVYMVFPYMDHDLAGLLENERVKLQPSQVKLYMKQLLEGTEYMHRNNILHRDMKAANLLISNTGSLQIADFGLARSFDKNITHSTRKKYTNCVVTRWYRPPELLLGARQYGGEVDIWGIGCVFGEMFNRRPILPGNSDLDQLERIWALCGTPTQLSWPNFDALPGCEGVKRFASKERQVIQTYSHISKEVADLMDQLLICNPKERITASQALEHDYFWTDPLPADPKTLPKYEASHEFDKRGQRNHAPVLPFVPHNQPSRPPNFNDPHSRLPPPGGHPDRRHGHPYQGPPAWGAGPPGHGHQGPPRGPHQFPGGPPGGPPGRGPGGYPGGPPPGPGGYNNNRGGPGFPPHHDGMMHGPPQRTGGGGPPQRFQRGPPGPGAPGGFNQHRDGPPRPPGLPPRPSAPLGGGVGLGIPRGPAAQRQPHHDMGRGQPSDNLKKGRDDRAPPKEGYQANGGLNYG